MSRRQVRSAVFSTVCLIYEVKNVVSSETSRKRPSGRSVSSTYVNINLQHCRCQHVCLSFAVKSGEVDWKTLSNVLVAQALGDVCSNFIVCYVSYGTQRYMFFVTSGTVYLIY